VSAHGTEPNTEPLLFPDPVIEAYIKDVDRTLLRENLRMPMEWRFDNFSSAARSLEAFKRELKIERVAEN
jgi:hypothetical protein